MTKNVRKLRKYISQILGYKYRGSTELEFFFKGSTDLKRLGTTDLNRLMFRHVRSLLRIIQPNRTNHNYQGDKSRYEKRMNQQF